MDGAGKRRSHLKWTVGAGQTRQAQLGLNPSTDVPLPSLPRAGERRRVSGSASSKSNNKNSEWEACGEHEVRDEVESHGQREVRGGRGEREGGNSDLYNSAKQSRVQVQLDFNMDSNHSMHRMPHLQSHTDLGGLKVFLG